MLKRFGLFILIFFGFTVPTTFASNCDHPVFFYLSNEGLLVYFSRDHKTYHSPLGLNSFHENTQLLDIDITCHSKATINELATSTFDEIEKQLPDLNLSQECVFGMGDWKNIFENFVSRKFLIYDDQLRLNLLRSELVTMLQFSTYPNLSIPKLLDQIYRVHLFEAFGIEQMKIPSHQEINKWVSTLPQIVRSRMR